MGNLIEVEVHKANEHDTKAGVRVIDNLIKRMPNIKRIMGDKGYRGTTEDYVIEELGIEMYIAPKLSSNPKRKRWIVERTISWINNFKRLVKDYEIRVITSKSMIVLSMIRICLSQIFKFL